MKCAFLFFILSLILSCETVTTKPGYFDMESYFNDQVQLLDSIKPMINKRLGEAEKMESIKTKFIHWHEELKFFSDCNLNQAAWKGKFIIDTIPGDDNYSVIYSAVDTTMHLQFAMIDFDSDHHVTQIRMKNRIRNKLFSQVQTLNYIPSQSYSIETRQDIFLGGVKNLVVLGTFVDAPVLKATLDSTGNKVISQ